MGDRNRSALAVMNGVPNSPAHRYNQVLKASISNNTFVGNKALTFGAGANEELSLPPENSVFSNNLIIANTPNSLVFTTPANGIAFSNNVMEQPSQSFDKIGGIEYRSNVVMTRTENEILYPEDGAALGLNGIGIKEGISLPTREETGPIWYSKPDKVSIN